MGCVRRVPGVSHVCLRVNPAQISQPRLYFEWAGAGGRAGQVMERAAGEQFLSATSYGEAAAVSKTRCAACDGADCGGEAAVPVARVCRPIVPTMQVRHRVPQTTKRPYIPNHRPPKPQNNVIVVHTQHTAHTTSRCTHVRHRRHTTAQNVASATS